MPLTYLACVACLAYDALYKLYRLVQSVDRSEFAMASERLNVFKLATDKLVYITKSSEEIVIVIANTSELNRRIDLTPNRLVALFFSDLPETLILSSLTFDTHRLKSLSIAQKFGWLRLDILLLFVHPSYFPLCYMQCHATSSIQMLICCNPSLTRAFKLGYFLIASFSTN